MRRWFTALCILLAGSAAGFTYGRFIAPVKYVDTTPASLRIDYRADFVLMIAEAFHADQDAEAARKRLSLLSADSPSDVCVEALAFGGASDYSRTDIDLLEALGRAMVALEASSAAAESSP